MVTRWLLVEVLGLFSCCCASWNFTAKPSTRLQHLFDIPSDGWTGGDEDTSLQLKVQIFALGLNQRTNK